MNIFDVENSVVSSDDLHDGIDFVSEFSGELQQYTNRITGSKSETACARTIRRRLADETGATVRLEAYKAYPLLGRGSVPILGVWYILCYVLYFVSFAGKGVAGILLSLLSLCVYAVGCAAMIFLYIGKRKLRGLFAQKISYNVVSEFSKNKDKFKKERIFVIADNHDAVLGNFLKDYKVVSKLAHIFVPLTAIVLVLFCIIKMAIGTDTAAKITVLSVIPAVLGVLGIATTMLRFSPFERHAKQNNGIATSIAMATYAYFVEQPQLLDDDVRIVYASFGGENSAHGGSEAFVKAHPEFKGANVLCIGDIEGSDLKIADMNAVRKIRYSTPLVSVIRSSAHEQKIDIGVIPTDKTSQRLASIHGYMPDAFAQGGYPSAMICAGASSSDEHELDINDLEKVFSVTVGTMLKLMKETPVSQSEEDDKPKKASSDMEIHAAIGK